jgi:hypothetical protein
MWRLGDLVGTGVSEERIASSSGWKLLVTANIVPSSLILSAWIMEAISFSEMPASTWFTWCHIPEDSILHNHSREKLKSYKNVNVWKPQLTKLRSAKGLFRCKYVSYFRQVPSAAGYVHEHMITHGIEGTLQWNFGVLQSRNFISTATKL